MFDSPQRANFDRTVINIAVVFVVLVVHDHVDIVAFLQMHRSQSTAVDEVLVLPVLSKQNFLHWVVSHGVASVEALIREGRLQSGLLDNAGDSIGLRLCGLAVCHLESDHPRY